MSNSTVRPNSTRHLAGCALAVTLVAVGCRTAPLLRAEPLLIPSDGNGIERAIAVGARRAGWLADEPIPGRAALDAKYVVRPGQFAVVRIDYAGPDISFHYAGSNRLLCQSASPGGSCARIHKNYNKWLQRLRAHIEQALTEPAPAPINESQALSIIRQMLEEQPHRTAYTIVDVDEARVAAVRHEIRTSFYPDLFSLPFPYYYGRYYGRAYGFWFQYRPFFYDYNVLVREFDHTDVVYFNNIGRIQLAASGPYQVVQIFDRYGKRKMKLLSLDETLAKRFIDALEVMEDARRADAETPGAELSTPS